ncbi:coenzyme F420 biosynthesis-associated protein [Aeromicrobium phragmitis]|uniref:Coenzyme F420 biosynthesis-associated protein n=1 Tax=Aeromicrobium phragmitis TaxID=2478914 RepID=A0A3L8PI85_9ACTN|nr:zinc-dependent metalloprotease [Aeromicrobium phragmitis]RLV54951.1 coenzyme F420 biosynthesis-associated protein [Aeromicrobium phragmitis]
MIDWKFAQRTAERWGRPGPEVTGPEVAAVVAELREAATRAVQPVADHTGLTARDSSPVLVVDRPRWVEANLETFRTVMDPVTDKLSATRAQQPSALGAGVGAKIAGAELGALMAFLSSKVLGQFDPFWEDGAAGGRLLLVAPNILHVERELGVDPSDFRQWVCLHEETHRAQFTGVPWMRGHLRGLIDDFIEATDLSEGAVGTALGDALAEVVKIVRGQSDASLSDVFQNEQQTRVVDQMTGLMSLLEGHADVVMDAAGPELIGSVSRIRRKFDQRRRGGSELSKIVRRLLGLEAKMSQYRDGAIFVRKVTSTVGADGFAAVWAEPANLPSKAEIHDPDAWVARVHG